MVDCLFCKIAKHEIGSAIVYETGDTVAFLDIHPKAPGHTMVIPKRHAETILELTGRNLGQLFRSVQEVTRGLRETLSADGFTIGWNHGKKAGQIIEHLHVHIIPRFENDRGGSIHSVVDNPPKESLGEIRTRIQQAWK